MSNVSPAVLKSVGLGAFLAALALCVYCSQWVVREPIVADGRPNFPRHISQLSWASVALVGVFLGCAVGAVTS